MFLQNFGDVKNEVFEKKIAFFVFVFLMLEKWEQNKKRKWKRPKKPCKIGFLRWSCKHVKNLKKRNGFFAKIA